MGTNAQPGTEYTLESIHGNTVRARAESSEWKNSKGIRAFDATLLEDFGGKEAGDFHIIQTHIFSVVD